jgi:phage FluMu gp28-like protein
MTAPISREEWTELRRAATEGMSGLIDEVGLPKVLLPYQARAVSLLDNTALCRVLFVEKSRRVGLTWGLAAYAVLRAGRERPAGGMDVMYISYSQEMTREFIDACAMWARAFATAAVASDELLFEDTNPADPSDTKHIKAFRIQFASGFEVLALSSAPRGLRGKQGVVIIDEAAFVDNLAELLKAALAFLMWGGQVVVCSTHNGVDNAFNGMVQDILAGRKPYRHLHIDFDEALRDGLYQRICLRTGDAWTPAAEAGWRQEIIDFYGEGADEELFCIPALGSGAWLPAPLIEARMTAPGRVLRLELPADYLHRPALDQAALMAPFLEELGEALAGIDLGPLYAFGFDFGRVADLSTVSLLAIEAGLKRREALALEMRNVPGDEQKRVVGMILDHVRSRLVGAAFDATGMGWTVAEDMGRRFGLKEDPEGPGLVWAIRFSEEWYRLQMPPLKAAFEDDHIALIADSEHVSDLRMVKLIRGIPRVPPVREGEKGRKRHGDYAIALALAYFASRMRWVEYGYVPVPVHDQRVGHNGGPAMFGSEEEGWWRGPLGARLRGSI